MLYGLGGYQSPTRGLTSDDVKLTKFEGMAAFFGVQRFENFGARMMRRSERAGLRPPEERRELRDQYEDRAAGAHRRECRVASSRSLWQWLAGLPQR